MKKKLKKLVLNRETLLPLNDGAVRNAAGGDMEPDYTRTVRASEGAWTCEGCAWWSQLAC